MDIHEQLQVAAIRLRAPGFCAVGGPGLAFDVSAFPLANPRQDETEWRQWRAVGDPVLHIDLRRWADVLVVAPLSANSLAKLANGAGAWQGFYQYSVNWVRSLTVRGSSSFPGRVKRSTAARPAPVESLLASLICPVAFGICQVWLTTC